MPGRGKALADALDRLETRYGRLVPSTDPVEAGVLSLLAWHAPKLSTADSRDKLRGAFCDWNEMRVSDAWDVSQALEAGEDPDARNFARAALRFLESINAVLHRTSFDAPKTELQTDLSATLDKMRGAPPAVKAVVLAAADSAGGWHPSSEMAKVLQKLGVVGKTASPAKAGKEAQEIADADDRLRAHYLLARYATREKEEDDPLESGGKKSKASGEKKPKAAGKSSKAKAG
jgi:hypothetical protein